MQMSLKSSDDIPVAVEPWFWAQRSNLKAAGKKEKKNPQRLGNDTKIKGEKCRVDHYHSNYVNIYRLQFMNCEASGYWMSLHP